MEIISNNSRDLSSLTVDLEKGLNDTRDNLTEIQTACNALPQSPSFCNDTNIADLATQADFTNLPNISKELSNVEDVVNQDFEKSANDVSLLNVSMPFLIAMSTDQNQMSGNVKRMSLIFICNFQTL